MNFTLWTMCIVLKLNLFLAGVYVKRSSWHLSRNTDIWSSANDAINKEKNNNEKDRRTTQEDTADSRLGKVFNLFPVPVDGECLSTDGRRTGMCFNVYECRLKGGIAQGECSMGFGVCCIFLAKCGQIIRNNITYLVSPNFPSAMPQNLTSCKYKLQVMDSNVSQLRFDFNHFSLGQPNRKTGVCDGDVFSISGGRSASFLLCGQNSGQHVYYDIGENITKIVPRTKIQQSLLRNNITMDNVSPNEDSIEIIMSFSNRFSPLRFWEIRVAQILFSQRAPANCLQYYNGNEGVVQTFNFADNGRHLANQDYKICIRQEAKMCSIIYQPCDEQSFKIGPTTAEQNDIAGSVPLEILHDTPVTQSSTISQGQSSNVSSITNSIQAETTTAPPASIDDEGSGEENFQLPFRTSTQPIRGGFDILSFFRSAFNFRNLDSFNKHIFTLCDDRITMPCIIEDFVGVGMGPIPGCEPVHCGNQFCASDVKPCRIESTVTPFYLGIHFGKGVGKGSAEENIGACIRFTQMQCI